MSQLSPLLKKYGVQLRVLLVVLIFAIIFYFNAEETRKLLAEADLRYVGIAFALGMVDRVLMAYKWNVLLRAKQIWIPLWQCVTTYMAASFLGLFLPATVGGDALRSYSVSQEGHPLGDVLSTVVVERLLGVVALIIYGMVAIVLSVFVMQESFFESIWTVFWVLGALLIMIFAGLMLAMTDWFAKQFGLLMQRLPQNKVGSKIAKILTDLYQSFVSFRNNKLALGSFLGLSLLENCFPIMWNYLIAMALNIQVPVLYFFILVPIALIVHRLPLPTPDGWGIAEVPYVWMLTLIGFTATQGLLLGVATHLLTMAIILPGGIFYLANGLHRREKELSKAV